MPSPLQPLSDIIICQIVCILHNLHFLLGTPPPNGFFPPLLIISAAPPSTLSLTHGGFLQNFLTYSALAAVPDRSGGNCEHFWFESGDRKNLTALLTVLHRNRLAVPCLIFFSSSFSIPRSNIYGVSAVDRIYGF